MRFAGSRIERLQWIQWLLDKNWRAVCAVIALALFARALVLPWVAIPDPRVNDEYSYLLMADSFAHHRLTNPTPAAWQHFETFHVNLTPTYHSKYPLAQGAVLAFGQIVFNQPWIGVYLSTALLCGAICWALQAFLPSGWALIGGLLAVVRLGLFSYWMNSYWGGSVAALGGAVALGAVVRLFDAERPRNNRLILSSAFGVGLLILATSRPYEGLAFSLPLLAYFGYQTIRYRVGSSARLQILMPAVLIGMGGLLAMGYYNHRTTGNALLLPYVLNERTYSPLPFLMGQQLRSGTTPRDPVFADYYKVEAAEHGYESTKSISGVAGIELRRFAILWFFFVGPALSLPFLVGIISCARGARMRIALAAAATTAIAVAACNWTQVHYYSPATVAIFLFAVEGLRYFWDTGQRGERAFVVAVCLAVLAVSLAGQTGSSVWDRKFHFEDQRKLITEQLSAWPGKHIVLVSYDFDHHYPGNELVHNGANFAEEKILWARSKGEGNDLDLCSAYRDRTFWRVITNDEHFSVGTIDLCKHP